jgi:hypothetical protein
MSNYERLNASLQSIVQQGVILDAEQGALKAWMFMQQGGVSDTTILRVLAYPHRRRATDTAALECARKDGFSPGRRRGICFS